MDLKYFEKLPDGTLFFDPCEKEYAKKHGNVIVYANGKIESINDFCYDDIIEDLIRVIELDGIILRQEELDENADYYTVQFEVDGFGNDNRTFFSSKSLQKCVDYLKENMEKDDVVAIVGQYFDKEYINEF